MSSAEENDDSDIESSDEDEPILSDESSNDENDDEEDHENSSSPTPDKSDANQLNYDSDDLDNPAPFSVNLHEVQNKLKMFHPEATSANYNEIKVLTNIKRVDGIIVDPNHKTLPLLSKYERTKIIGQRAKQIEDGDTPYVTIHKIIDPYIIALLELEAQKIPFIVRRPLPNGTSEYWNLKDLQIV
jgi:DNA-directed RNA polymerases I, II, and III subunit RPABC2